MTLSLVRTTAEWVHAHCEVAKEIDASREIWKVMDGDQVALVAGFLVPSLIGWADMWIIPLRITPRILRARHGLMELARSHWPLISAHVEGVRNEKFARFFGFRPQGPKVIGGRTLVRMELWPKHSQ
jgi:hypothetical protein